MTSGAVESDKVVDDGCGEDKQGRNLDHNSRHEEIIAYLLITEIALCSCGNTTAGTLYGESEDVAADEDPGVILRFKARMLGSKAQNKVF